MIRIVFAGTPVPDAKKKSRSILNQETGKIRTHHYTPAHTAAYSAQLRVAASDVMGTQPPIGRACKLTINVFLPVPRSFSMKKTKMALAGYVLPETRPDLSNYYYLAENSLKGIVYRDDSLVCSMSCCKVYSDKPRIEIEVELINGTLL